MGQKEPMKFLDQCKIFVRSGDGGRGGDVWIEAADGLNTLIDYRYQQHFKADTGVHGMGRNRAGHNGEDVVLKVPVGTQVLEEDRETLIADLDHEGARLRLAKGGNGGFGNAHFKGPINRAPRFALPGQDGEERWIWLRLKLIADVGLVGLPNAGKSTLLAAASAARPKIADYPFTTLTPNLGVVELSGQERFVLADIPGLIEGASEGAGVGIRFLGHIERSAVLVHLVDGTQEDVGAAWRTVRQELEAYGEGIEDKAELVALNKADALDPETRAARAAALEAECGRKPHIVSGVSGEGVTQLLRAAFGEVRVRREALRREETTGETPTDEAWRP